MDGAAGKRAQLYERFYVVLVALFIASLVACNLIFLKFFSIEVWLPFIGPYQFEQSVGLLAYPFTFLVTDVLSEVYGRRRANQVVLGGFVATLFVMVLIMVTDAAPASSESYVDSATYSRVFGLSAAGMTASMVAYLVAQFMDIRLFHFWRRLTGGRHLWLRNNASTFGSQVVDTTLVLFVLAGLGALDWKLFPAFLLNGVVFKWIVALVDTPLFYGATAICRRLFPEQVAAISAEELG
jgi:uncharacterized integral membrane protein (TIGR00697 family)